MFTPVVSVCIPAYQADKYLQDTLRSVAAQTFRDWELIVTEDGSNDRTQEIVRQFAATVQQTVTYNRHTTNQGLPATRNTGIAASRGAWVAFLDSDDLWKPDHLERLMHCSQAGNYDLIFAGTDWFEDRTERIVQQSAPTLKDLDDLPVALYTGRLSVLPSSVMLRRTSFEKYGPISGEFPRVNDTEYWLRVLRKGGRVGYSGAVTCLYRKHPDAMSAKASGMLAESALLCERYADWIAIPRSIKRERASNLYRWAAASLLRENPREAVRIVGRALRLDPLNPKNLVVWARSLLQMRRAGA